MEQLKIRGFLDFIDIIEATLCAGTVARLKLGEGEQVTKNKTSLS